MILLILLFLNQNPFCESSGFNLQPDSPAIGYGVLTEMHCPTPGPNDSGCIVWYNDPPDVGACPFVPANWQQIDGYFVATLIP